MDRLTITQRQTRITTTITTSHNSTPVDVPSSRRVWVPDATDGFLPGWIKSQHGEEGDAAASAEVVIAASGEVRTLPLFSLSPMNPPQFDGVDDIADLTHLNEASVINNLKQRYGGGDIYTYSGLFLISLNPYRPLPIYTSRVISQYRTRRKEENPPHIFAVAERAWQQIGEERESQSILITGESGAGKTENTKKVIQYLAAIASTTPPTLGESSSSISHSASGSLAIAPSTGLPRSSSFKGKDAEEIGYIPASTSGQIGLGLLERQILQANPILEAFGNAQTMRNNNSSRFGKFIRIFFSQTGSIAGANIDWYLLEKSRVTSRAEGERCFHVFYQLLKGAKEAGLKDKLLLDTDPTKYEFLKRSRQHIDGVDDVAEWRMLQEALNVVGFSPEEQLELFRVPATILHIGNLILTGSGSDQALFPAESQSVADKVCHLLGIPVAEFTKSVLRPKVRAGREWVTQSRSKKQAEEELGALCKFMYEKTFGWMVERINKALDRPTPKALSIGVLDIAGFEIFEENSYEQLLINFTNEKLQQFFNFHMFTLEQEEYAREGIEWNYVNFGLDLQPTIELIESSQPIGILAVLDEECIMPKASDRTFTEKVQQYWDTPRGSSPRHPGSAKYAPNKTHEGFVIKHYAGDVEYKTTGWLEKNKDPINDAVAKLCAQSEIPAIAAIFAEYAEDSQPTGVHKKVKRGAFRTVGQRHKEQLGQLMTQLSATQPHFVRCIVPNSQKTPGKVEVNLVLDQLRCNGVLEGIRIARLGYPNRHSFAEFRQRYEVLAPGVIPPGYIDGRKAAERIAEGLDLDRDFYKIGSTKIFFKAGVLAELEERRDHLLSDLFRRFQSAARMHICRRRLRKLMNRAEAIRTIQRNARTYIELRDWPWWSLYVKVRPLLAATRVDDELVKKQAELAMAKERAERDEKEKKKLEELRATLLTEKQKVELDLSSERQLGRDRDLMLERSKKREAELQDKINELESDLAILGDDRETALREASKLKDQLVHATANYEALIDQATMLEKQSQDWRTREADLLKESNDRSTSYSKLEMEKAGLSRKVEELKREVAQKEEATKRAKERAEMNVLELEKRLQLEKGKIDSGSTQVAALTDDLRRAQRDIEEVQALVKKHEASLATKQREIADLFSQQQQSTKARESADQAKIALQVRIDALASDLASKEREKKDVAGAKDKLQKELDDLRKVMAAKTSEDSKRLEADKSREAEMSRLRDQALSAQKALEAQGDSFNQISSKLKVEMEDLRQRHVTAERELKAAKVQLQEKAALLNNLQAELDKADEKKRAVETELRAVQGHIGKVEAELKSTVGARDKLEAEVRSMQDKYNDLEDAVLLIEDEKAEWAQRMESTTRQLVDENAKRQHFEQQLHNSHVELAQYRNIASTAEREMAKAASDIKARDSEIALLRSRENKTIVEHVHVLEQAKKVTDRQLVEQVKENSRLNTMLKTNETHRNRLIADLEDKARECEMLKKNKSKEARVARASMSNEDREASMALEDERKARKFAEAKIASLERDLQDQRRQLSTANLHISNATSLEAKLQRRQDEFFRLEQAHDLLASENQKLQSQILDLQRSSMRQPPSTPKMGDSSRAELLRGLQQSHDALGRDMNDQLRKLDAQPLTPSRRHNTSFSNGTNGPATPDPMAGKRMRQLETEIAGLRNQLDDERDEKEFLIGRLRELEGPAEVPVGNGTKQLPYEQAMYSHFRLKAKSLRTQLDHWLAMEDLNNAASRGSNGGELRPSLSAPFAEDVVKLKQLLNELDPDTSALRR